MWDFLSSTIMVVIEKSLWNCRELFGISPKWKNPVKNVEGDLLHPFFSIYMLGLSKQQVNSPQATFD